MNLVVEILNILVMLGVIAAIGAIWKYFPKYLEKKAENLATSEDIGRITETVESIKSEYIKEQERITQENRLAIAGLQQSHELRLAALDERLKAHQEAYALCYKLISKLHDESGVIGVVFECTDFWVQRSLYLSAESRKAFNDAIEAAENHNGINKVKSSEEVKANYGRITNALRAIENAVLLPNFVSSVEQKVKETHSHV